MLTTKHTDGHEYGYVAFPAAHHKNARVVKVFRLGGQEPDPMGEVEWDEDPSRPPTLLPKEPGDRPVLEALLPRLALAR